MTPMMQFKIETRAANNAARRRAGKPEKPPLSRKLSRDDPLVINALKQAASTRPARAQRR